MNTPVSSDTNVVLIRAGEGLPGDAPEHVFQYDFTLPLKQRVARSVFVQQVKSKSQSSAFPPNVYDMHAYLANYIKQLSNGIKQSFTYNDLLEDIINKKDAFREDWEEICSILQSTAPQELQFDFDQTVENMGAGQVKGRGALVALAFLAADGGDPLLKVFDAKNVQMVVLTYGANGSTGVGFALAAKNWLNRVGITTVLRMSLMAHQPSLAVQRTVYLPTVNSVLETQKMLPGSVLVSGLPLLDSNGVSRFWEHLLTILPDLSANAANAEKKSRDRYPENDAPFPYSKNLLMLVLSYRPDLANRYLAYLLAHAAEISERDAVDIIKKYISQGWLTFGVPDPDGYTPLNVSNYRALQLRFLRELLPALAYVTNNELAIADTRKVGWIFKREQAYSVKLRNSNLVRDTLEQAGVTSLLQLQNGSGTHASYIGLAQYEHQALENSDDYTLEQIDDYFNEPGNWFREAAALAAPAFKGVKHFEPAVFAPTDREYYTWTQLADTEEECIIRALKMMGANVQDPRVVEALRKAREEELARLTQRKTAGRAVSKKTSSSKK